MKLAEEFVDGAKTTKTGSQVTLDFKRPETLDTAGAADRHRAATIDHGGPRSRPPCPADEQHAQVGLAMINYESTYKSISARRDRKGRQAALELAGGHFALYWKKTPLQAVPSRRALGQPAQPRSGQEDACGLSIAGRPTDGKTRVMVFTGKGAAFDGGKKVGLRISATAAPTRSLRRGRAGQGRAVDQAGGPAF